LVTFVVVLFGAPRQINQQNKFLGATNKLWQLDQHDKSTKTYHYVKKLLSIQPEIDLHNNLITLMIDLVVKCYYSMNFYL
jgi:hypothetical protein